MAGARPVYTKPKLAILQWLTDPGEGVSPRVGMFLLGELFADQKVVVAASINAVIFNAVALWLTGERIFCAFIMADLVLLVVRLVLNRRAAAAAAKGLDSSTDACFFVSLAWSLLQGAMGGAAMASPVWAVRLLAATTVATFGPLICARNYAAPRLAYTLTALCQFPTVVAALTSHDRTLLIIGAQIPLFFFGLSTIISRFSRLAIASLDAEHLSDDRARRDALTGLLNRFGLMEMLDTLHDQPPHDFVLFYLDLDGFKPINDNFGHHAGDKALQLVAERLQGTTREGDIVARLGGDEFVVVAPGMSAAAAAVYADRMIRTVSDEAYLLGTTGPLRIGVSVGFACAPEDGLPGDDLHRKADAALYDAKAAGKCVHRRFVNPSHPTADRQQMFDSDTFGSGDPPASDPCLYMQDAAKCGLR